MLGSAEPSSTTFVIVGGKSSKSSGLGFAELSSVQIKKMPIKFSHKHERRQTGHTIHCPTAVWDCIGQVQSHQALATPSQSHSLCPWLYVRYGPATVMIQRPVGPQVPCCALAIALEQAHPDTTLQGGLEARNCPFFRRWGCRSGCRCQIILLFFPLAICSLVLFGLFLLLLLLLFTLPLPCLLLLHSSCAALS